MQVITSQKLPVQNLLSSFIHHFWMRRVSPITARIRENPDHSWAGSDSPPLPPFIFAIRVQLLWIEKIKFHLKSIQKVVSFNRQRCGSLTSPVTTERLSTFLENKIRRLKQISHADGRLSQIRSFCRQKPQFQRWSFPGNMAASHELHPVSEIRARLQEFPDVLCCFSTSSDRNLRLSDEQMKRCRKM